MPPALSFDDQLAAATRSAVHLEMRDAYTPDDPEYVRWLAGEPIDWAANHRWWMDLMRTTIARGVRIRRARIASEPLAPFIRFEHEMTGPMNVAAGEEVRWLPRRLATDIALPGNDFWVFDDKLVCVNHFAGDGGSLEQEVTDDPAVAKLCASAFEAVWERAIPHGKYLPG